MGSYGGVKICQLVDLYVLSWLQNFNINVGLIKGQGILKEKGLKIAVEAKTKVVGSFENALNLSKGLYKP